MAVGVQRANQLTMADMKGRVDPDWCPGCGDFGVLAAVQKALIELQIPNHNVVTISYRSKARQSRTHCTGDRRGR